MRIVIVTSHRAHKNVLDFITEHAANIDLSAMKAAPDDGEYVATLRRSRLDAYDRRLATRCRR